MCLALWKEGTVSISFRQWLLLFVPLLIISGCRNNSPSGPSEVDFSQDPLVKEIITRVQAEYVEDPDLEKMKEGALRGMLLALDPYSVYMNQDSYELFKEAAEGEYGGIGVEVVFKERGLRVVSPVDDTPAAKAGLQPGDYLTVVDGVQVTNLTYDKVIKMLHGEVGKSVKIKIERGEQDPFELTLERAVIPINTIKFKRQGDIGYIRISYFNEKTTDKLKEAIQELNQTPIAGLILDLRNNPGGLLDQGVDVASQFLNEGTVVEARGRAESSRQIFKVNGKDLLPGVPIVALINGGSASAAEIVAGALKDYKRAVILGRTSLGKGSVQGLFPLNGRGAIKLTTSRFFTPHGHSIHGKGIAPDIVVDPSPTYTPMPMFGGAHKIIAEDDNQLNRAFDMLKGMAILRNQ